MKKTYLLLLMLALCIKSSAQLSQFGTIDIADLKLKECDFEKGAKAMILFDNARVTYNNSYEIVMKRHKRIKIFYKAEDVPEADIRIEYWGGEHDEEVKNIEACAYNLVNGKIEATILDKTQFYVTKIDKHRRALIFAFPNIKAGTVIEYKYTFQTRYGFNYPNWFFQKGIPTRYSQLDGDFETKYPFNVIKKLTRPLAIDSNVKAKYGSRHIWAMKSIPSFTLEPLMHSVEDNIQSIYFKPARRLNYWSFVTADILKDEGFGEQLTKKLEDKTGIVVDARLLNTQEEKIAFIFNTVKNTMKWNNNNSWYSGNGIDKAWANKKGNSTEINLILYNFLQAAGVKPKLLVLGTRDRGELELDNAGFSRLNKTVVQVAIDSLSYYVLDASGKYNTYNNTPYDLLNLNMLGIDPETKENGLIKLVNSTQSEEVIFVNAEIKTTGKLEGSVQLSSSNYRRIDKLQVYDELGENIYIDNGFKAEDKLIQISDFKRSNLEVDTLPLREDFNFKMDMKGFDDNYIYFNPNIFTGIGTNPFIRNTRVSEIDFIYLNKYNINGRYKIPPGYKVDALPKQLILLMPDKSISFKRTIGAIDGVVIVNYIISFAKTTYTPEEYPALHAFYKQMYEMLNEQIVLKKY